MGPRKIVLFALFFTAVTTVVATASFKAIAKQAEKITMQDNEIKELHEHLAEKTNKTTRQDDCIKRLYETIAEETNNISRLLCENKELEIKLHEIDDKLNNCESLRSTITENYEVLNTFHNALQNNYNARQ